MDNTFASILQNFELLQKLFPVIRENESETDGMSCSVFEGFLLKKLRDEKVVVCQLNQAEHLFLLDNVAVIIFVPETNCVFLAWF